MRRSLSVPICTVLFIGTLSLGVADDADERTLFSGPHSTHLDQLVSFIRLKAALTAREYDCKRIHFCTKGAIKSALLSWHAGLNGIMRFLSEHHHGILGSIANGYVGKDCAKLYPKCFTKIRVITAKEPCKPYEACFTMGQLQFGTSSEEYSNSLSESGTPISNSTEIPATTGAPAPDKD